jgi:hypothetical protein
MLKFYTFIVISKMKGNRFGAYLIKIKKNNIIISCLNVNKWNLHMLSDIFMNVLLIKQENIIYIVY